MPLFDVLATADLLVDSVEDVDLLVAQLVDRVGLPEPRSTWVQDFPGSDYKAVFARVHPKLAVAPTTIEVIGMRRAGAAGGHNAEAWRDQEGRPVKTHATVVGAKAFDDAVERVQEAGVRHHYIPADENLPFGRLWLGIADDDKGYDPSADGGLRIEVIPFEALRLRPEVVDPRPSGSLERVVARSFHVADVQRVLDALRRSIGWGDEAEVVDGAHGPTAVLQPSHPGSAALELVEPTAPGYQRDFFEAHGPGPFGIRLGVNGLSAKLDDLDDRGTPYDRHGDVVVIDPSVLGGAVVELVEL